MFAHVIILCVLIISQKAEKTRENLQFCNKMRAKLFPFCHMSVLLCLLIKLNLMIMNEYKNLLQANVAGASPCDYVILLLFFNIIISHITLFLWFLFL